MDFNTRIGNDSVTRKGMTGRGSLTDLNLSGALLLNLCANHSLSITNTMFEHEGVNKYNEPQDTLCHGSMIDFVIVCSTSLCVFLWGILWAML